MNHPHIATGKHMEGRDARFRINTHPSPMKGVNEAHGSFLERKTVIELRDELNAWLEAHPTVEEKVVKIVGDRLNSGEIAAITRLIDASRS